MSNHRTTKEDQYSYEVITQRDENGDLLLPIPSELLAKMGWKENDQLDFGIDDQGRWIIKKI